jgi:type IV pilus biogenesis protein CpaD/CtpE
VSDDICAKLERLARYAPAWSDVLLAAAAELRQTRKERDEARGDIDRLKSGETSAMVERMLAGVSTGALAQRMGSEIIAILRSDLAAAVELLRKWAKEPDRATPIYVIDDTRAFLEAVEKRGGGR